LDGQSSYKIVSFLKKLAATGQSVLCTIHQPSAALFSGFDNLLLLKGGGNVSRDLGVKLTMLDCILWRRRSATSLLCRARLPIPRSDQPRRVHDRRCIRSLIQRQRLGEGLARVQTPCSSTPRTRGAQQRYRLSTNLS
jgi:hypothetical protein